MIGFWKGRPLPGQVDGGLGPNMRVAVRGQSDTKASWTSACQYCPTQSSGQPHRVDSGRVTHVSPVWHHVGPLHGGRRQHDTDFVGRFFLKAHPSTIAKEALGLDETPGGEENTGPAGAVAYVSMEELQQILQTQKAARSFHGADGCPNGRCTPKKKKKKKKKKGEAAEGGRRGVRAQ